MLNKNIYIFFPPGYSGTYVSWILSRSEQHSRDSTVPDPINRVNNQHLGGAGTSHGHTRIPTHQGLHQHLLWCLYNRPESPLIYIINTHHVNGDDAHGSERCVDWIMHYDKDPVFINIHDGGDADWRRYGQINAITKWPIYFKSQQILEKKFKFDSMDANNIYCRNIFAQHRNEIFPYNPPMDRLQMTRKRLWQKTWYETRNFYNPHEVNEDLYVVPQVRPDYLYEIHLKDITSHDLITQLQTIVEEAQCGDYDFSYCRDFHDNYIQAQKNLQWFPSLQAWRDRGELDDYLMSTSITQAMILEDLVPELEKAGVDWQSLSTPDCVNAWKQLT